MPNQNDRPSLTTDLLSRYQNQKEGGAFDAKQASTSTAPESVQASLFEKSKTFVVKEPIGVSGFKNDGKDLSAFVKGLDNRKYKG